MAILAVGIAASALGVCWIPIAIAMGRAFGLEVSRVQLGVLRVFDFELGRVPVAIGLFPVSSWVKFKGSDPAPADDPGAVDPARPGRRDLLALPLPARAAMELLMWLAAVALTWPLLGVDAWRAFGRGVPQILSVLTGGAGAYAAELVRRSAGGIDAALVALLAVKICALNVLGLGARYFVTMVWRGERGESAGWFCSFAMNYGLGVAWVALTARALVGS